MVVCATRCNSLAYKGYGCYCGFFGYVIDGVARRTTGATTLQNASCSQNTSYHITGDVITVTNPFVRLSMAAGEDQDLALNVCAKQSIRSYWKNKIYNTHYFYYYYRIYSEKFAIVANDFFVIDAKNRDDDHSPADSQPHGSEESYT
ncbi:uncharacterized protein [Temnothorax longispinosus]|uniref:uncharacterized protein n=1 Tax=Temnothorax longispinosus TaxID=300112 RepID=UPI003A999C96